MKAAILVIIFSNCLNVNSNDNINEKIGPNKQRNKDIGKKKQKKKKIQKQRERKEKQNQKSVKMNYDCETSHFS